jgi:hypothetical protein
MRGLLKLCRRTSSFFAQRSLDGFWLYWARKTNSGGCVEPGKSLTDAVENTLSLKQATARRMYTEGVHQNRLLWPVRNHDIMAVVPGVT